MEREALELPPLDSSKPRRTVYFLTGSRFWFQTVFCAWTFAQLSDFSIRPYLIDDGTLRPNHIAVFRRIFGELRLLAFGEASSRIDTFLPLQRFPTLQGLWRKYINIRKLIDPHLMSSGPKLVMDSDMLFFDNPLVLSEWIENRGGTVLHMLDCAESYGYPRQELEDIAGSRLPERLNVGICGLQSEWLNWAEIELIATRLISRHGMSYFLEQALVAILAARYSRKVAPEADYKTVSSRRSATRLNETLIHYVADSKPVYFGKAWRIARELAKRSLPSAGYV